MPDTLLGFIQEINKRIGFELPSDWQHLPEVEVSRRFLAGVNEYFFQTHKGIGTTRFQGEELQYFSEFHKFWEKNHAAILDAQVSEEQARKAAQALAAAIRKYGNGILGLTAATHGLPPQDLASVRFLTANQDFREPPEDQFRRFLEDPTRFAPSVVADDPVGFLSFLGMARLSQTDKRTDYARNAARFLLENGGTAYGLAKRYGDDVVLIREALVCAPNIGYGAKKANMFLRDMMEMGVWPGLRNVDALDVASDINTMQLALRTRIVETAMPLLSSFLDIFCYQYSEIDRVSALAWRRVWEHWRRTDPDTAPAAPASMDFLLYRMGREHCKDNLVAYVCDLGHEFNYFGARLRLCPICTTNSKRSALRVAGRRLPCQVAPEDLPRSHGKLAISDQQLLNVFDGQCIFTSVCDPCSEAFIASDPPKSISIKGQTGWTNSYSDKDRGGGGMMG